MKRVITVVDIREGKHHSIPEELGDGIDEIYAKAIDECAPISIQTNEGTKIFPSDSILYILVGTASETITTSSHYISGSPKAFVEHTYHNSTKSWIEIIKDVRGLFGYGLKEAKELVEEVFQEQGLPKR